MSLPHPVQKRSNRHNEEVRVFRFYSLLSQAALLLLLLIRLLYMFTYSPLIMLNIHVVKPEVYKQHSPSY